MRSSNFIFDLIFKRHIPPLYDSKISLPITDAIIDVNISSKTNTPDSLFVVKDIPSYLKLDYSSQGNALKRRLVKQYEGYCINLTKSANVEEYIHSQLSKRNSKNLFAKKAKLEKKGTVRYQVIFGASAALEEYEILFDRLYELLKIRFEKKKIHNRDLIHWNSLKASIFPMIKSEEASLFVIYDGQSPINITLNFHIKNIIFSHIQGFDITYESYGLGDISLLKQLEWCFANNIKIYDLMIGKTYYKEKWCNTQYHYNYEQFYKSNIQGAIIAWLFGSFYKLKQFLRDRGVIGNLFSMDKFAFRLHKLAANFRN